MKDLTCMGVGVSAVLEPKTDRGIWAPKLNGWQNVDVHIALEEAFGLPVHIEYDGHMAVLGEWWLGAGKGHQSVIALIVGTGIDRNGERRFSYMVTFSPG